MTINIKRRMSNKDYKKNYSIVPTRSANDMSRLYYTVRYCPTQHTFEEQFFDKKEATKFINELVEMNNEEEKQIREV